MLRPRDRNAGRVWSAERLRDWIRTFYGGESIVVLANREPFRHDRGPDGDIIVRRSAGGLVTALEPLIQACSGVWVAHGAGTADRVVVDGRDGLDVPPANPLYRLRRVWLDAHEARGYYCGFANEGLWPLCHRAHVQPVFRSDDFSMYQAVNARFAEAVCEEVETNWPVVLVQDYHFALAPHAIRERLPLSTIVAFWHIPWPHPRDYTKGLNEKVLVVERLLELHPEFRERFVLVQIAEPSRDDLSAYRSYRSRLVETTDRINVRFGTNGYRPLILLEAHHEPAEVYRFLRAADVCYVGSLHDGMNLVAKEFVSARDDDRGVLILSKFTGAARELAGALIVNPYAIDDSARALAEALRMADEEQSNPMRTMRSVVAEFNTYRWAGEMLADAARLRTDPTGLLYEGHQSHWQPDVLHA